MHPRVNELHNIMPIDNIPSVLRYGILSNNRASKLHHQSIAMDEIQDRRDKIRIPGGSKLHHYANLYFDARNPMMYKRKENASDLCILRVSADVLKIDGTVIADRNASSDYVRFLSPDALEQLDFDMIFAADWRHSDEIAYYKHRSIKCAEVLIPDYIDVHYIVGAFAVNDKIASTLRKAGFMLQIDVNPYLFSVSDG